MSKILTSIIAEQLTYYTKRGAQKWIQKKKTTGRELEGYIRLIQRQLLPLQQDRTDT